jgi:Leucine rich repeat
MWKVFTRPTCASDFFFRTFASVNAQLCVINIHHKRVDDNFCNITLPSCQSLKIESSSLRVIPQELAKCYPNLLDLNVKKCRITLLESTLKHEKLKTLNLAENQLKTLNADDFTGVRALETLDLSLNQLKRLQLEIFNGLALKVLKISNNQITTLATYDNDIISCCSTIENLDLRHNSLENVNNLQNFIALKILDLSDNVNLLAHTIPFDKMTNLSNLKLNNANLKDDKNLGFFKKASNLRNLSIARNQFPLFNISNFPTMEKLVFININQVKFVHHEVLKQRFSNLKSIKMTSRSWTCDVFYKISNYLEDNSITWLKKDTTQCKHDQLLLILLSVTGTFLMMVAIVIIFVCCKQKMVIKRYQVGVTFSANQINTLDDVSIDEYDDDYINEYQEPFRDLPPVESEYMDVGDGF